MPPHERTSPATHHVDGVGVGVGNHDDDLHCHHHESRHHFAATTLPSFDDDEDDYVRVAHELLLAAHYGHGGMGRTSTAGDGTVSGSVRRRTLSSELGLEEVPIEDGSDEAIDGVSHHDLDHDSGGSDDSDEHEQDESNAYDRADDKAKHGHTEQNLIMQYDECEEDFLIETLAASSGATVFRHERNDDSDEEDEIFLPPWQRYREEEVEDTLTDISLSSENTSKLRCIAEKRSGRKNSKKRVSFDQLHVREYSQVKGDHPCCTVGPAVSLGWKYHDHIKSMTLEDYEATRQPRRTRRQLKMNASVRRALLRRQWTEQMQQYHGGCDGEGVLELEDDQRQSLWLTNPKHGDECEADMTVTALDDGPFVSTSLQRAGRSSCAADEQRKRLVAPPQQGLYPGFFFDASASPSAAN